MLNLFRKDTLTPQTERIYKVPLCVQDTIPIYRIAENRIFELESPTNKDGGKKKLHQFDRMSLCEAINFSTQDEEGKRKRPGNGLKRCFVPFTRSSYPIIMQITEN